MRSQSNLDTTTKAAPIIHDTDIQSWAEQWHAAEIQMDKEELASREHRPSWASSRWIPRHEQDDDRWRFVSPGRDPVTEERGPVI